MQAVVTTNPVSVILVPLMPASTSVDFGGEFALKYGPSVASGVVFAPGVQRRVEAAAWVGAAVGLALALVDVLVV
jgi:hypothetical protein